MPIGPVQALLKRETSDAHLRVDRAFSRFRLDRPDEVGGFLYAQGSALTSIEAALESDPPPGIATLLPDWPSRQRAHLFDDVGPAQRTPADLRLQSIAARLGAAYVLEGSRLGARVLLRRLPDREDANVERARRFLAHNCETGWWTTFLLALEQAGATLPACGLVAGAKTAFCVFEAAAIDTSQAMLLG